MLPTSRLYAGIINLPQGYALPSPHVNSGIDPRANDGDLPIGFTVKIILKQPP